MLAWFTTWLRPSLGIVVGLGIAFSLAERVRCLVARAIRGMDDPPLSLLLVLPPRTHDTRIALARPTAPPGRPSKA
jgi:hypothetical protein